MKEKIGDAIRNAAMRFGVALDLWAKIDLHVDDDGKPKRMTKDVKESLEHRQTLTMATSLESLGSAWDAIPKKFKTQDLIVYKDSLKSELATISDKINACTAMDELTKVCDMLTNEQELEYSSLIEAKIDEFNMKDNGL
jgi:hypothetical protein